VVSLDELDDALLRTVSYQVGKEPPKVFNQMGEQPRHLAPRAMRGVPGYFLLDVLEQYADAVVQVVLPDLGALPLPDSIRGRLHVGHENLVDESIVVIFDSLFIGRYDVRSNGLDGSCKRFFEDEDLDVYEVVFQAGLESRLRD
jgi:hypothetical protein